MACPDCGSWTVKADRGLSGRLVCGRCGRPLGIGAARRRRGRFFFAPPRRGGARLPPGLALVGETRRFRRFFRKLLGACVRGRTHRQ